MYLSNELISKRVKSAKRLLIVGGIFTAMSVYGIVAGLAGNAKLRSGLATYLVRIRSDCQSGLPPSFPPTLPAPSWFAIWQNSSICPMTKHWPS